jgi:hypothetical protein
MDDLDQLFRLAGNNGTADDWNHHFDPIGLILQIPPKCEGYWCTPLNSVTFARTGGDGTHYGLLSPPGLSRDTQPVVMTVPMSDEPNVVVGESLREFLALGCRFGYFALEGLVHQPSETLSELESGAYDQERSPDEIRMLERLQQAFDLRPWRDPKSRLAELRLRYFSKLVLPPRQAV